MTFKSFISFSFTLFWAIIINAQNNEFEEPIQKHLPLYLNGIPYFSDGAQTQKQHQFFKGLGWTYGTLTYEGREIKDVLLLYNVYEEALIAYNNKMLYQNTKGILLDNKKVSGFEIHNSQFTSARKEKLGYTGYVEHYYDSEKIDCFIKWKKEKIVNEKGTKYKLKADATIKVEGALYNFNGSKTLWKIFPEQKKQIKHFMNRNYLKLNSNNIEGLEKVLGYCEQFI